MIAAAAPVRTLPADVYDFLELSALVYGGIGAGKFTSDDGVPHCVFGHLHAEGCGSDYDELYDGLSQAGIHISENDTAVRRANRRRGIQRDKRVPFSVWATELGVVRGGDAIAA